MSTTCPECNQLLDQHDKKAHQHLNLISKIPGSHLFKCKECDSYLHFHENMWEMLLEGFYNTDSQSKHTQQVA